MSMNKISELELALRAVICQALSTASFTKSYVYRNARQFGEKHCMDEDMIASETEMRLEPLLSAVDLLREADRLILCANQRIDQVSR